jgi:hypothetical protein
MYYIIIMWSKFIYRDGLEMDNKPQRHKFIAQLLISIVLLFNITCAFQFLISPQFYNSGFGLFKESPTAIIRGYGILFLMWNIPYLFALANPIRFQVSLIEAIIMQSIGILGEGWIRVSLPQTAELSTNMITRFLYFDVFGLIALTSAWFIVKRIKESRLSNY